MIVGLRCGKCRNDFRREVDVVLPQDRFCCPWCGNAEVKYGEPVLRPFMQCSPEFRDNLNRWLCAFVADRSVTLDSVDCTSGTLRVSHSEVHRFIRAHDVCDYTLVFNEAGMPFVAGPVQRMSFTITKVSE